MNEWLQQYKLECFLSDICENGSSRLEKITHEFYMNNNVKHMFEIVIARESTSQKLSRNIFLFPFKTKTRNSLSLTFVFYLKKSITATLSMQ